MGNELKSDCPKTWTTDKNIESFKFQINIQIWSFECRDVGSVECYETIDKSIALKETECCYTIMQL